MAVKGAQTKLFHGNQTTYAASTTWTAISGITDITPNTIEAEDVDVSTMESTEQYSEFDPGWADAGELQATLHLRRPASRTCSRSSACRVLIASSSAKAHTSISTAI